MPPTPDFLNMFLLADAAVQVAIASLLFSLFFSLWGLLRLKRQGNK